MGSPTRSRAEPHCARCGNEEDLRPWPTGAVYCVPCHVCEHADAYGDIDVCVLCFRTLHTIVTFEGPRILSLPAYRRAARVDYALRPIELAFWTHEEEELSSLDWGLDAPLGDARITQPPPHHRNRVV